MPSERIRRQIDQRLDEAERAFEAGDWTRLRELCDRVLRLDPGNEDARAFLEAAVRDPGIGEPGAHSASPSPARRSQPPPSPAPRLPASFVAGRYRVRSFLGEGAKKRVYLAHDTRLDRDVAFAVMRTEGLDTLGRRRMLREAQAMGRLGSHPQLVSIYDVGDEEGRPYMVMEHMAGGSLQALLEGSGGPLPLDRTLAIAEDIGRGLEFVHARQLVHRDLKPGNVFIGEDGRAKVADFGLAVALDRTRLTQQGMLVGTATYMAPEQALGGEVTAKSDLYALGCILYEMVTGRPPFTGDDPVAVISQHINTPPVAPSWHSEQCPVELEALILHLLRKAPEERPASTAGVRTALAGVDPEAPGVSHSEPGANPLDRLAWGVFVGREDELGRLRSAFDEAFAGRGRLVMLVGEPGIGKTRTTQELETYARTRGARVLWGHAYEASGVPAYYPWLQVGEAHSRFVPPGEMAGELAQGQRAELARIFPGLRDLENAPEPPEIRDPESGQFRLFEAYTAFVRAAANRAPLVVVLDDLHWADKPSLLLLRHLGRELARMRVLVVGTYRDTELARTHPLSDVLASLNRETGFLRVVLRGLSRREVAEYVEKTARVEPAQRLLDRIYEETEGNPFFLSEVVSLMAQEGTLAATSLSDVAIPDAVREAIGRRLNLLSDEANELLTMSAVVGRQFSYDTLRLVRDGDDDQLVSLINEGLRARVIEELPQPGRYQFTHAQMQETLLSELSTTSRVHLSGRIASALERRYGEQAEERYAARLAHYYFESATLTDGHAGRALHYGRLAAEQAEHQAAWAEAARQYERCVAVLAATEPGLGTERPDEAALLFALGRCLLNANAQRDAYRALMRSMTICRDRGDPIGQAQAALQISQITGPNERFTRFCIDALEALGNHSPELEGGLIGQLLFLDEESGVLSPEARRAYRARLDQLASAVPGLDVHVLWTRAWDAHSADQQALAADLFLRAHDRFDAAGDYQRGANALFRAAWEAHALGPGARAQTLAEDAMAYAARHGISSWRANAKTLLAGYLWVQGKLQAALALLSDVSPDDTIQLRAVRAHCVQIAGLGSHGSEMLPGPQEAGGNPWNLAYIHARRARFFALAGDIERAKVDYEALLDTMRSSPGARRYGRHLLFPSFNSPALALREAFSVAGADYAEACLALISECDASWIDFGSRDRLVGCLQLVAGRRNDARRSAEAALRTSSAEGLRFEEALSLMLLAELDIEDDNLSGALAHLDEAQQLFQAQGATLYVDRIIAKKLDLQRTSSTDSRTSIDMLAHSLDAERPDLGPRTAPDGTVTVLFSDIEGSTALNVELGDDRWMDVLAEHNRRIRECIASHQGFEVKTVGDAFMVAFGSARDAVRCAVAIQRAFAGGPQSAVSGPQPAGANEASRVALGTPDSGLAPGGPIRVRIGLHTGEPVRHGDDFFGTHVTMASRIVEQAKGGEILVSSLLRELVAASGEFELAAREPVALKGLAGEHVLYAVSRS